MAAWVATRRFTPALLAIGVGVLAALPWFSPAPRNLRHTFIPEALPSSTRGEVHPGSDVLGRDPRDLLLYDTQGPSRSEVRTQQILERLDTSGAR